MPEEAVVFLVIALAILGGGVAVVVMAISAYVRVARLEKQVAELIARGSVMRAPEPAAPATGPAQPAPTGPPAEPPPAVVPAPAHAPMPAPLAAGVAAATAPAPPAAPPVIAVPPGAAPPRAPVAPPAAATPRPPFDWEAVIAGRWLFRVGLLAVAIGVSYFLKLAIDNDWIGPTGQVALGLIAGVACVAGSALMRQRGFVFFADGVTGLGAALLYLSIWAGGSYYSLIPLEAAFALMAVVTASMIALAIGRDSQPIAVLGLVGGFLTPILLSTGRDAQVVLFSYLAVLNAGLLPIAWRRSWRFIEAPAFVFTQLYFWGWYGRFYGPERLSTTAVFAVLFFVEFAIVPVLRSLRAASVVAEHFLLVPVNAGACLLAMSAMLWPDHRWALTITALALAAAHLAAASAMPAREGAVPATRLLYGGVALTLATIAIPLRLDGRWITIAWAIEGVVLMWSSFRTRVGAMRVLAFGVLGVAIWRSFTYVDLSDRFVVNADFTADAVTVACGVLVLWLAHRYREQVPAGERVPFGILAVIVNVLALRTLTAQVSLYFLMQGDVTMLSSEARLAEGLTISMLWTLYAAALIAIGMRTKLPAWRWQGLALFGITTLKVFFADLSYLRGGYRVLSSIGLGLVLLAVSFVYQRRLQAARSSGPEVKS